MLHVHDRGRINSKIQDRITRKMELVLMYRHLRSRRMFCRGSGAGTMLAERYGKAVNTSLVSRTCSSISVIVDGAASSSLRSISRCHAV